MSGKVSIVIVGNARDAVRALKETRDAADKTSRSLTRNSDSVKKATSSIGVFGLVAKVAGARVVGMGAGIALAVPYAVKLVAALAPLLGYLEVLPAALVAGGAAMAAFKIATAGVADALTAGFSGSMVAYQQALNQLQPAQREFVASIIALRQPLANLKATVSNAFFAPFMKDIAPLAKVLLPVLQYGLKLVAQGLGEIVHQAGQAAKSSTFLSGLKSVMVGTATALRNMAPTIGKLVGAFGNLLVAAGPTMGQLLGYATKLADKFAGWLNNAADTGKLATWLKQARDAAGSVYLSILAVKDIMVSLFEAGSGFDTSRSTLDTIRFDLQYVAYYLRTDKGSKQLAMYFKLASDSVKIIKFLFVQVVPIVSYIVGKAAELVGWLEKHKKLAFAIGVLFVAARFSGFVFSMLRTYVIGKLLFSILKSGLTVLKGLAASAAARFGSNAADVAVSSRATKLAEQRAAADVVSANAARSRAAADLADVGYLGKHRALPGIGAGAGAAAAEGGAAAAGGSILVTAGLVVAALAAWGIAIYEIASNWDFLKRSLAQDIPKLGHAIWNGITAPSKAVHAWFVKTGQDIVNGLISGIYSKWADLKKAVTSLGSSIAKWISEHLGIHSPSTVMHNIGRNVGLGLVNGLRASLPDVQRAVGSLSAAVSGGSYATAQRVAPVGRSSSGNVTHIHVHVPVGANMADAGKAMTRAIRDHERSSGHKLFVSTA